MKRAQNRFPRFSKNRAGCPKGRTKSARCAPTAQGAAGLFSRAATAAAGSEISAAAGIGLAGCSISSIYSVIFSRALSARPGAENEISGLMATSIAGGAVVPPLMTFAGGKFGGGNAALAVLFCACLYLALCAFACGGKKNSPANPKPVG